MLLSRTSMMSHIVQLAMFAVDSAMFAVDLGHLLSLSVSVHYLHATLATL